MNESKNGAALDAVNGKRRRILPASIQNALGALLVVLVTGSVTFVYNLWDSARDLSRVVTAHLDFRHAQHVVEWEDFDQLRDDYEQHKNAGLYKHRIIDRELEHIDDCLARLKVVENTVATLPHTLRYPFSQEWQNRILTNTLSLTACGCLNSGTNKK